MKLVPIKAKGSEMTHHVHGHEMKPASQMSRWEKFRMSMTMTVGMEHTGVAGREMGPWAWSIPVLRAEKWPG